MFNNKGNNKDKKDYGVNTRGIQLKNKNGIDPSTVIIGYWNDMMTLKIHPALPKEKQTQENVYDYEHALNTALTLDKVQLLFEGMRNLEAAIVDEKQYAIGVKVGQNSVVMISTGVKETGSVRPYLAIYKDLDADTEQAGQGIRYEFNKSEAVINYDAATGKTEEKNEVPSELLLFKAVLKSTVEHLTNASVHSMRNVQNYYNTKQMEMITAVASKMGIETGARSSSAGNNSSGSMFSIPNNGGTSSPAAQSPTDAPVVEGSLDDDLPF